MTNPTFKEAGLQAGDVVKVILDERPAHYFEGQEIGLYDVRGSIRAPDMTNGSAFTWEKED